ncbi:MAG: bifunctional diaminohydroxyphosphoribosylaminopyrimidine deaminase/5-amino-6-(5-phosphoribosylamino)uracil reductase RibD [Candidatus Humimicrobiaceae bacterium]
MDSKKNSFSSEDKKFMNIAYTLAEKGRGTTSPNPLVGAVIVKDGKMISSGYHKMAGTPHAEINAINAVKSIPEGSKIYVTLEPCSFYGKTPPCTEALIKHKFSEVIISTIDPNPKVNGQGVKLLEKAGIAVKTGLMEEKTKKQNEIFFTHITKKRPFICVKIASTIDGKLAAFTGDSKWITGTASRNMVQNIRFNYGCILTGINTVIKDDPLLFPRKDISRKINLGTVKDLNNIMISKKIVFKNESDETVNNIYEYSKFFRVILDSNLKLDLESGIVKTAKFVRTILFVSEEALQSKKNSGRVRKLISCGIELAAVKKSENNPDTTSSVKNMPENPKSAGKVKNTAMKLDLKEVLDYLYLKHDIASILIEAGPTLVTSFLSENLIDKFLIFLAPKIIGGDSGYNMFSGLGIASMYDALNLKFSKIQKIGPDLMIEAYPLN